ncbi:putative UPF0426 protein [Helianthus annuus]|uniref:UPF0426 protein n=1 Tax=Helianthus annuus TaxID=4232 RepID=A0A251UQ08_HELAN|nr:UPF0426 protein At1g28150, chloroplastic [Helianthus annuus]KAF5805512.1 putative UPF0426 protein [Helianthus annuus]KAJ0569932.1 putative UPF0426 protein [Helianthus annuus]KAJ0576610.1 putative UPF0426 protein [Helianthus annuus]KAJ0584261.1 putative UPF0426 protein [Helianthus annuus]KAJ0746897.1 putative UPF0426 protein [Helianthus annuus]
MASLCLIHSLPSSSASSWKSVGRKQVTRACANNNCQPNSFFLSPSDERILKKALKEPVAFMGGMFAGVLRLDLNEDPLKEWVTRTVEASGFVTDEDELDPQPQEVPQQIEIE